MSSYSSNYLYLLLLCFCAALCPSYCCTAAENTRVVILGDSLTKGLGVAPEEAFPAILESLLRAKGNNVTIVNAGISGSTSSSGPSRLAWLMRSKPAIVVIALGANDGLRGKPVTTIQENLATSIQYVQKHNAKVLLVGMKLPYSYGNDYRIAYEALFCNLAKEYHIPLVPFLLENIAGIRTLNQADGVHPNAKGHVIIAHTVEPYLERML